MISVRSVIKNLLIIVIASVGFVSCNNDEVNLSQASLLNKAEGVIELTSGIGDWDAAYLTKLGYFCYKQNASETADQYSSITYMPAEGSDIISLISTKSDNIPTQLVTSNGTLYFSFPNDSILELLYDDGKNVAMLDSIAYSKQSLIGLINAENGDAFKATLSATASLLNKKSARGVDGNTLTSTYGSIFDEISKEPYIENDDLVSNIATSESGDFKFVETIAEWYGDEIEEVVCNAISLWTGNATYKVGGSSCTLSGTIWCPSNLYNLYGTYGIICDEDPAKLLWGEAEYEAFAYQHEDELSFSVDFRGFKPNTTYYYRAFYKFNSDDHGNMTPKYGDSTDQIIYDTTIKSFKTGDNILNVDVVMCIDVTGSMSSIIGTVKKNAISFYDSFNAACIEEGIILSSLNSQVIAFQDINNDGDRWMNISPTYSLPGQRSEFNSFVNDLYADDGGDIPESGLEALDKAFDKEDWGIDDGYHRQIVILWTDAPYLTGAYSSISIDDLKSKWDNMPSGRRLILFAPYGNGYENGGNWAVFDSWKNVIHESDLSSGFNDFDYILKSIIGELTGKSRIEERRKSVHQNTCFRSNK